MWFSTNQISTGLPYHKKFSHNFYKNLNDILIWMWLIKIDITYNRTKHIKLGSHLFPSNSKQKWSKYILINGQYGSITIKWNKFYIIFFINAPYCCSAA